jgi:hypothetical protein
MRRYVVEARGDTGKTDGAVTRFIVMANSPEEALELARRDDVERVFAEMKVIPEPEHRKRRRSSISRKPGGA